MTSIIPNIDGPHTSNSISCSSEFSSDFQCWHAFNDNIGLEWATKGETSNYMIQYKCEFDVVASEFILIGRSNGECPQDWQLQAWNAECFKWDVLYNAVDAPLDSTVRRYTIDEANRRHYKMFRFYVLSSTLDSVNPGICQLQLYQ